MLDDARRAEYEQAAAEAGEYFPHIWWGLFRGCVKEGFTESQSLELVKAWISINT